MENEEINKWELLAAIMPSGIDVKETSEGECEISNGENTIKVIDNGSSYVIGDRSISFEDTEPEIINTLLLPFIMQELDGQRRF
jgi:hypothetical protein